MISRTKLLALTGDRVENPTMSLSARAILGSGQKGHEVHGLPRYNGRNRRSGVRTARGRRWHVSNVRI